MVASPVVSQPAVLAGGEGGVPRAEGGGVEVRPLPVRTDVQAGAEVGGSGGDAGRGGGVGRVNGRIHEENILEGRAK